MNYLATLLFGFLLCFGNSEQMGYCNNHLQNDTIYFVGYKGINFDTTDSQHFDKLSFGKRFKADSADIIRMEERIPLQAIIAFKNKIKYIEDSLKHDSTTISKTILKQFSKKKKKMISDFQNEVDKSYTKYDREYFGYFNENGKQILVKYIPQEIPPGFLLAEIRTLPLMSYDIETAIVNFPDN